jgi:hypothetical protein
MVSVLYVQYNALLTAFLVGEEWSRFACTHDVDLIPACEEQKRTPVLPKRPLAWCHRTGAKLRSLLSGGEELRVRKTLRVSTPEGIQRSSYFVSMPLKYGIPLISAMSLLHWLISQSIFVYTADVYTEDGSLDPGYGLVVGTGFSIEAIIFCESRLWVETSLY